MSPPRLQAQGLQVRLGPRLGVDGVSVALAPGALVVVVGPNGAGKTTLLRALAGLLTPSAGSVTLDGRPLRALAPGARARTIAYLPQGGGVAWPIPVASVVALGRLPHGERVEALPPAGRRAVEAALGAVGLTGFEARPATALSGGERARVLLARALATQAPVLLADEPVAALDPRHQLLCLEVLRARARAGAAVLAVMHDLALAARFADRVLLLREGRLVAEGTPGAVLTAAQLAESFGIEAAVSQADEGLVITPRRALD